MRLFRIQILTVFILTFFGPKSYAQRNVKDSTIFTSIISTNYSFQWPAADMADRFGYNNNIGGSFQIKTRSNLLFGFDGSFIFGNQLKENGILDSIKTSAGFVIDINGKFADVRFYERGYSGVVKVGKIFPVFGPNPNSGILFSGGLGFIQHKIRIEDIGNASPPLTGDYKKGYDRLTNGLLLTQFLGYFYMGNRPFVNFFAGFEISEGFTQNRRSFNFDTMERDDKKRVDILFGPKAGFMLLLYRRSPQAYYLD